MTLSVVVPLYNEEENVRLLHQKLREALDPAVEEYELLFVDDGSTDSTLQILEELQANDNHITVLSLRRNFGQTAAFAAGFDFARGEVIVTMDGDLQNDPADIPNLLAKIDEGYDVVSGWRADRKDKFISRRIPSILANKLIVKMTEVNIHDFGCTLKAYRKEIIDNINLYGEMHRFIPALAKWVGASITEIKVRHHPRLHGKSKYGISRTMRVILDLMTIKFLLSYSTKPIRFFGRIGITSGFLGFLIFLCASEIVHIYLFHAHAGLWVTVAALAPPVALFHVFAEGELDKAGPALELHFFRPIAPTELDELRLAPNRVG